MAAAEPAELYEEDFFAWTRDQTAALRRMSEQGWQGPLDLDHLAEEIEDVGSGRRDGVRCRVRRIIEHLLKLECSRARAVRSDWKDAIDDARAEIEDRITPSIRQEVEGELPRLYHRARIKAANALLSHDERDAARALPATCPYGFDAILDDWYPVNRHGIHDDPPETPSP